MPQCNHIKQQASQQQFFTLFKTRNNETAFSNELIPETQNILNDQS
jgi:hypothetical protein